jgi:hypothetical protein
MIARGACTPHRSASDGMRVGMQWRTDYGRAGICVNTHGVDANYPFGGQLAG